MRLQSKQNEVRKKPSKMHANTKDARAVPTVHSGARKVGKKTEIPRDLQCVEK